MKETTFGELDRIEAELPDIESQYTPECWHLADRVSALMSELAQEKGGLELLIDRYSGSQKMIFPRAIADRLGKRADQIYYLERPPGGDPELDRLMIRFLERLTDRNEVAMLTNTLNALQLFAWYGGESPWRKTPDVLLSFLERCLAWTGKPGESVRDFAVTVTSRLLVLGWLSDSITRESAAQIVSCMEEIASSAKGSLDQDVQKARTFLRTFTAQQTQ